LKRFGGERGDSRTKHGFKMSRIPVFPNSLQPIRLNNYIRQIQQGGTNAGKKLDEQKRDND